MIGLPSVACTAEACCQAASTICEFGEQAADLTDQRGFSSSSTAMRKPGSEGVGPLGLVPGGGGVLPGGGGVWPASSGFLSGLGLSGLSEERGTFLIWA